MDNLSRPRPPPLAAIYMFRRSNTLPLCRITGKSHSMDEHHYVPCMDNFPKLERSSGCRITEKQLCFKDYKYAYPIIDLDGTTRLVTEHDFHCRITSKYRAMAGHKYVYPVLGATTDKKAKDMTSVIEDKSLQDVVIPSEVELIIKGGIEDVLRMHDSEYLFIQSKEGSIIPAALREIRGKGSDSGGRRGRRHTLPAGLESGAVSDLEEFRRSLGLKMLSEIKQPPVEVSKESSVNGSGDLFDVIRKEVEVLKDVRKSRPKRPGRNVQKNTKVCSDTTEKENLMTTVEEDIDAPSPKMSRLEKYKLQFSSFESHANTESGNRLTLVGAFDENEAVELDFNSPVLHHYESVVSTTRGASTGVLFDVSSSTTRTISTDNRLGFQETISTSDNVVASENKNGDVPDVRKPALLNESNVTNSFTESFSNSTDMENTNNQLSPEKSDENLENSSKSIDPEKILQNVPCAPFSKDLMSELKLKLGKKKNPEKVIISTNDSENSHFEDKYSSNVEEISKTSLKNENKNLLNELQSKLGKLNGTDKKNSDKEIISSNDAEISYVEEKYSFNGKQNSKTSLKKENKNVLSELQSKLGKQNGTDKKSDTIQISHETEKTEVDETILAKNFNDGRDIVAKIILSKNENVIETSSFLSRKKNGETKSHSELKGNILNVEESCIKTQEQSSLNKKLPNNDFSQIKKESQSLLKNSEFTETRENTVNSKLSTSFGEVIPLKYEDEIKSDFGKQKTTNFEENAKVSDNSNMEPSNKIEVKDEKLVLKSSVTNVNNKIFDSNLEYVNKSDLTEKIIISGSLNIDKSNVVEDFTNNVKDSSTHIQTSDEKNSNPVKSIHDTQSIEPISENTNSDNQIDFHNLSHSPSSFSTTQTSMARKSVSFTDSIESHDQLGHIKSKGKEESQDMKELSVKTVENAFYKSDEKNLEGEKQAALIGANGVEIQWQGIDVYVAIMDFKPMSSDEEAVAMKEGQRVEIIDASKPRRWLVRTIPTCAEESPQEGMVPACYLEKSTAFETLSSYVVTEAELDPKELEAIQNREAIVKELIETEEDFAKDMLFVVENYYKQMDNPKLPKEFRDRKGSVFGNFKDISDFHNNVLMKGVNYHAKEPTKLGKTFLRLERDFDMHANYCWNEARAQKLLKEGPLKEFFDEHSKVIEDDKLLIDHLKLPIQRLNDYQLLLKELIKYSSRLNEDTADLQKALDFIHSINTRTKDLLYIQAIEGCQGDLLKIGRILNHDVFDVNEGNEVSASERYVFLFKGRVFVTEKRIASEKESYHVTNLFKLQDVELVENVEGDALKILFRSHKKNRLGFPLSLRARSADQKATWLKELLSANQVVEDLGDLEPNLGHPLLISSTEQLAEKAEEITDKTENKKEQIIALKRQDSEKKTPETSDPQTPTESDTARPSLKRQGSVKKSSAPQTPTDTSEKPPKLLRQDSKKAKSTDSSAPETPTEVTEKPPKLSRQESKKSSASNPETPVESSDKPPKFSRQDSKKSKASDTSAPDTPIESSDIQPSFTRQDSEKLTKTASLERQDSKPPVASTPQTPVEAVTAPSFERQDSKRSEASDTSVPQTPTESVAAPSLTRQGSVKKKPKKQPSLSEQETETAVPIPEAGETPALTRQDSVTKKVSVSDKPKEDSTKLERQDSLSKKDKTASDKSKPKNDLERQDSTNKKNQDKKAVVSDKPKEDTKLERQDSLNKKIQDSDKKKPEFDSMDKPRFSKTLRGVTCALGETAILECETEGSPEVTWLRDNQKLAKSKRVTTSSSGQRHSLTIKDANADDGGLYTVVASNAKGSASCSAPLNLKLSLLGLPKEDSRPTTPGGTFLPQAPVFKVKLNKETQLLEGTSVRFELVVRGNPEPQVRFLKDGKALKLDDRVRVVYETKEVFELILDHVVAKDAGTYTVAASNAEGEDKTVGNLSVVKHKDVFKGLVEDLVEEESRESTPRPKTPKFRWFKDGQFFEANERFQVIFNEEEDSLALMFQHVTPEDAGLYTCVASTSSGSKIACSAELTVQGVIRQVEAPAIKAQLSDAEATEGGSGMLELKITGFPKPKVTWYHKGKEVSTGGRFRFLFADEETFTLVIKNVKKEDGGKYSVKAANEMGEAESSCNLTVKSAPSFTKGLKDKSVMADEVLKFEVEIDGNPTPDVKWYKDGQPLNPSDRVLIKDDAGKQSLQILNAKPTDSGSYSCVLTNNLGNQAEFSNVVVKASPTFVKGMEDAEGLEGDVIKFNVEINGNPKPTLKWTKDGKELAVDGKRVKVSEESANCYTLTIGNATAADMGVYTCELRNEHGLKASSGNLNIKTKPEFIKKLTDMECNEGDTGLVLSASLKGYPIPKVKWTLDGKDLKDDKNYIISTENNGTSHSLKLKKANRSQTGKYVCEATNEMGSSTTSGALTVKVTVKKPEILQGLRPGQLVENKPGKLEAKISGEPKPGITCLKDDKPIRFNGHNKMEVADDGTVALLIDNVTPEDAGTYTLVASNEEGEAKLETMVTTIPPGKKPEFIKDLEKVDLLEGQALRLEAKVTGKPTSIKWQKEGEDISDGDRIRLSESPDGTIALTIDKVNRNDAGKYTVIASNAEGKARSAALVQVQAMQKPKIIGAMEPLTIKDGETGQLKIKASGEPKPKITWSKDGKELRATNRVESVEEPDGTFALVIKNARPEDAGSYSVVVQNSMGEAKSAAPVTVQQPPTFQKPLEPVNVVEGFPVKLEAKLSGSPAPEIQWQKDGEKVVPDNTHIKQIRFVTEAKDGEKVVPDNTHIKEIRSPDGTVALLIDNCKPEDAGKYSLTAKNPLGEDSSSGKLGVSGKESSDAPKSAPCFVSPIGNLTVKEGEPIRFEAEISGNPLPEISWVVNDEPLVPSDNTLITFDGEKAILEIKSSTPDHIGVYQCKLTNPLGEASKEGNVSVQEKTPPRFIQRLTDYNGFKDQPLRLSCKVTGYPEPEIDWYFNGDLISASDPKYSLNRIGELYSLIKHSCNPGDSGVYECKARNAVGEDHTRSAVNISDRVEKGEAPMFLKKIGDNEVMEGMTAKFTACVTGIPTPDVCWLKDGQPLEPSPRHKMDLESSGILRLVIRDLEPSDYGSYSVTISNNHGSATSSAKLLPDSLDEKYMTPIGDQFVDFDKFKKTGIPVPLSEKPRIVRMDDTSLTLGWKPSVPNSPRVPVTYQLEMAKHPDGEWTPYKTGLKDTLCDVRDLRPGQDYKFQVRVENKHGVSDPSPYVTAHRSKIYQPPKPDDFKPKDYSLEHQPLPKYAAPPKFVRKEEDTMYGVKGQPVTIEFWVYGHPEPQVTWFKGDSQIGKDKYGFMQDRNGKLCVFIDRMTDDFVGTYTCVAVNDEGEAQMKIKLAIAEHPVFLERLDETTAMSRRSARMQCRVTGLPYPKVKWFRDWHPLYESERVKILWEEPDKCTLFVSNLITRDNALYSCTATNIAGTATTSAALNVEDSEDMFDYKTYCRPTPVRPRTKIFEDFYDIGDELGRGTQGITYHAVKRDTGDSYAAKTMHGKGKLKEFMKNELDIMNQLCHPKLVRIRDAFETKDTLTLLTDICGGGELLNNIIKRGGVSERDIANYVKQILEGLDYMHSRYVGHLSLTIGDVMVSRVNSDDVRFGDFGVAARLLPGKDYYSEYGHPEFVAPEIAKKEPATVIADMWSVGVLTYLLLSGISPFLGENDRETLTRVQQGKINFVEDAFRGVSDDAKDFMSKLLVFDPKGRMDVKAALQHRWIKYYLDKSSSSERLNNLDRLKDYQRRWRDWYTNASCKRYYRRRTLESCFHHPSKMIYPPGESFTPSSSPEPLELDRTHAKPSHFDDVTFRQKINREDIDFRSESSYQNGPDTYLLQLRDTDFPLRLRQYLRVGAKSSPTIAASLKEGHWGSDRLVIRERRKFVDVMDEEIDDERKGLTKTRVPRRLYHEIGTLGFAREQMEELKKEVWKDKGSREMEIGMAPYFREKIRNSAMKENDEVVFRCYAVATPKVDYTWFRNDGILLESSRIVVTRLKDGRCELRINPTRAYDIGVYKCVARNIHGVSCCRARLKLGSKPGRPEPPVMKGSSDTEIYITWAVPRDEGNCTTLGYTLEKRLSGEENWELISNNIEHEYFVVRNLLPSTFYQFRVKAFNKFGWGEPGFPTEPLTTKPEGANKVKVSSRRKYQQEFTERTPDYVLEETEIPEFDYEQEDNHVPLTEGDALDLYRIVSEMDRGRFSVVLNVWVKESNTSSIAKVIQNSKDADGRQEYDVMKGLVHERIVQLLSASHHVDKTVLVMEKLSGVDVMSYLAMRHDYNEELVVTIIKQVLEAIQYLHFREICYLELQPDNVVMVNLRDSDIKLVDFGSARFVPKTGGKVQVEGTPEYLAPEVLKQEPVSSLTDVWCVGVLTYILLSGVSPFAGKDDTETRENVTFVRYHFDNLHADVTAEVTRFLLNIFKQCPIKRLTIDECLEHKWLAPSEYMIMKRESARFLPDNLAAFAKKFHAKKYEAMDPEMLTSLGMSSSRNEMKIEDF
ncbi:hypothetical protein JTE90_023344 [Oedothorax gibbosus]|uniref:Obscurin n=1 Tax=Oedothorax gibbosus TaxID=931172 RepID=A0AAV6VEQ7_9ARAC|nr:hypothetical protein JTE90_023344 [Oedothorax gibbosus]